MSSVFLQGFSEALIDRLVAEGQLDVVEGQQAAVVAFVAERLATAREGESLISAMVRHLLDCDDVVDLYADNDEIKALVNDLPPSALPKPGAPR